MSAKKVREKGQSKDTDKLIRRLSLVALLLSRRGQPVSVAEIREQGRGLPDDDRRGVQAALLRGPRRAAAARHRDPLGRGPALRDLVRALQPAGGRLLPRAGRAGRRRAGGPGRLPRRPRGPVRLLAAAPAGAAQPGAGAPRAPRGGGDAAAHRRPRVAASPAPPCRSCRRRSPSARRSSSTTTPSPATRPSRASSTPTACSSWPASGTSSAGATCARTGAPSGSRASAPASSTTRARPHDFAPPDGLRPRAPIATGPPGSWPSPGHARASASRRRWPGGSRRTGRTAARSSGSDDGGIVYETPYADARPLLGWVLGLADEAELLAPPDLRARLQRPAGRPGGAARRAGARSGRRAPRRATAARGHGAARRTPTCASRSTASPASRRWPATSCSAAT